MTCLPLRRRSLDHRYERDGGVAVAAVTARIRLITADVAAPPAAARGRNLAENCKNSAFETFWISRQKRTL